MGHFDNKFFDLSNTLFDAERESLFNARNGRENHFNKSHLFAN